MSVGNRGLYAAFGIVAVLATYGWCNFVNYQVQHGHERDRAAPYSTTDTAQQRRPECIFVSGSSTTLCIADSPEPEGPDYKTRYNLKAQQEMAEWAYSLLWVGVIGAVVTAIGVIYVALTLKEARNATVAAKQAADAAVAANRGFEVSSKRELRAYVWPSEANYDVANDRMVIHWRNAGQSPARNLKLHLKRIVSTTEYPDLPDISAAPSDHSDMGPSGSFRTTVKRVTQTVDDAMPLTGGPRWLIVFGRLVYDDVFDDPHETRFEFHLDFKDGAPTSMEVTIAKRNNKIS